MSRKAHTFVKKVLYPTIIASMVLWSLGPAVFPTPAHAAITVLTSVSSATSAQFIGASSAPTSVLGIDAIASAGETLTQVNVSIAGSAGFTMSDLATLSATSTSGIALYSDNPTAGTPGVYDSNDTFVTPNGTPYYLNGFNRISKITPLPPLGARISTDTDALTAGDILFTDISAGGTPITGYNWHVVTTGAAINANTLRLDGVPAAPAGAQPTYRAAGTRVSAFRPASTGTLVVAGTNAVTPSGYTPTVGDIVFYQKGTDAGQWGIVTDATLTSGTLAIRGSGPNNGVGGLGSEAILSAGTWMVSEFDSVTSSFAVSGTNPVVETGGYDAPAVGDIVLWRATGASGWGMVTNATMTSGTFAVDNMALSNGTYRISKLNAYNPRTALTTAIPIGADAIAYGDLVLGIPSQNPVWVGTSTFGWHMSTNDTSTSAADHRLDDVGIAPVYGTSYSSVALQFNAGDVSVPADNNGANFGNDFFVVVRTRDTATNAHAFSAAVGPGSFRFDTPPVFNMSLPIAVTSSQTYTISTTATQSQSAGATTTAVDMTGGWFLKLKQGSNFKEAAKIQFGSNENTKTLTSITVSFTGTSGTPLWPQSGAVSSELLDLATTGGGISLWKDGGSPGFGLNGAGDTQVTLAASPVYGASNTFTLTPATPPTITSDNVYYIVLKSDTAGVTNGNAFRLNLATDAIVATGGTGSPTLSAALQTQAITMDTTAPTITAAEGFAADAQARLTVRFSEPTQKINAGGALTTSDFTYTDNGSGRTISSIASSNPGQDFAQITMNGALADGDFDGTPSTIAAGTSKIEDMAGNVMGVTARNLSSPLTITTPNVPATYVGAVYDATTPLVTFAASGGTGTKTFSGNTQADNDALVALLCTTPPDSCANPLAGATGKLTGTVRANTAGTRNITIKVTDGAAATATRQYLFNVSSTQGGGFPAITQVTPPSGSVSTTATLTITGTNTSFAQGTTTVSLALPPGAGGTNGLTPGTVTVASATSLSVPVTIAANASEGARDITVTTGNQAVTMPGGFSVTPAAGTGLGLVFPTDAMTNIQLPSPGFSFAPSTNTTITHYRIVVSATQNFATASWDYVFLKPADTQNSNQSHCNATTCNLNYASGNFLPITPPTQLAPNTTYYWKVETYQDPTPTTQFASSDVTELNRRENTPVRSFTTTGAVNDTQQPQIEHRPIYEARANAAFTMYARVLDNIANASTTPALSTTLSACAGAACTPSPTTLPIASATDGVVAGTPVQGGYYSYTLPSEFITATVGTVVRYYIRASDGTNTNNFYQQGGTNPFQFTTTAAIGASGVTIAGSVVNTSSACPTAIQGALVFAEGTGFYTTTGTDCSYTLGATTNGLTVGAPYDIVAVRDAYAKQSRYGVMASSTAIAIQLNQGAVGGFSGDTTVPHVRFMQPGNGMQNVPGNDSNFRIMVAFDKQMSQTSVLTNGNMLVNEINVQTGAVTNVTANGSWAYYATYTTPNGSESNVAVWSLSGTNTLGDNKTIAVKITPSVTDTSGNAIQGNQGDGNYAFTFTTGSTMTTTGYNSSTNTFSGGQVYGQGTAIPPRVVGSSPPMGATNVPRNTKMMVNFDQAMADDAGTYTLASMVKLYEISSAGSETDVTSAAINAVTLTTDKMGGKVTLKTTYPSGCAGAACGVFKASTRYRIKILGGAKASNGMTILPPGQEAQVSPNSTSDFTTSATSDSDAPTIIGSYPDSGATGIPSMLGAINVSFNKDMDPSTFTTSTLTLTAGSTAVSGTVDYRPMERTVFFVPSRVLTPNTQYTLTLTTSILGINGVAIAATTRTFTTGSADTSRPTVTFMTADDTNISISFDKPMNASPATDTTNFTASVLKVGNYTVKYGAAGFNATTAGTTITMPTSANITYDGMTNTAMIQGYRPAGVTATQVQGQELYIAVASVKDIGGNAIDTTNNVNTGRAQVQNSATTQGQLGPMTMTNDLMKAVGDFKPPTFSSDTFGFAPQTEARPFNMMTGTTTIYGIRASLSRQIPDGGTIVLTFPQGFNVSGAKQDINSPKRRDINGPGTGTSTFKCQTNATGQSGAKSCGGGAANADDTGTAQGGLADDGVVVNANARTVTIYASGATNSEGHDMLDFDIAGIVNSTTPKDFNTSGYTISIATKNGATLIESLTSTPFFIQSPGTTTYTLSGTITATSNTKAGTISVFLDSPMTGPLEATTLDFLDTNNTPNTSDGTTQAAYTFSNLPSGDYGLRTEPYVTIASSSISGTQDDGGGAVAALTPSAGNTIELCSSATRLEADEIGGISASEIAQINLGDTLLLTEQDGTTFTGTITSKSADALAACGVDGVTSTTIGLSGTTASTLLTGFTVDLVITITSTAEYIGKFGEHVRITANATRDFTLTSATAAGTGTAVTVSVDGPSSESIDIFANGPAGFRVMQKTLDTNAGAENFTIRLSNGDWFLGVGPQMPKGQMGGPPPSPSYLPPKPVNLRITDTTCVIEGTTTCTKAFTLTTATKQIRGTVKDLSNKIIANANVFAYKTSGSEMGNFASTDSTGAFTLRVTDGMFNVGAMVNGMPASKEVPVEVTSDATTYLKIDGATTAITPAAAAASFVLKLAKPDYTISGKVTDGTNVINGASVYAYKQGSPGNASAPTDSSGNYSLFVSTGTWTVKAFLPKYGELAAQTVTITTANATDINFSPTATGTFYAVSGTVTVGDTGQAGAQVRIKNSSYYNDTRTDTNGAYSFNVPAGTGYIVDGFVSGVGELAPLAAFSVAADTPNKNLTVAALNTITITLSSSVTRAVVVELRSTTGANVRKKIENSTTGTLSAPNGTYIVNVDLQGAPIPFTAIAGAGGTAYASATGTMTVDGNEGLTVTVPTMRTLTITVQDAASAALADAWVELMNPTTGEHFGDKTATNGQVTLRAAETLRAADGSYYINAMKPGYFRTPTSLTVSANATQTLTLAAATRTISGTVYIGTTGAANAFIRADKQGGGFAGGMTDANGQYTLSVTEGAWRVFANTDGYAEAEYSGGVIDTTSASATGKNITLTTTTAISSPKSKPMTPSTGGSIEDTATGIKVNVPANALGSSSSAGNMQVKKTTSFIQTETARPVAAVEITATDANGTPIKTLNESVTVELTYTTTELSSTASSSDTSINTKTEVETLDVGYWDESVSNWSTLPTTITYTDSTGAVVTNPAESLSNVSSVKLSALTDHFSLFAPVVPTDPTAPTTPSGLAATAASTTQINLSWTALSGATGYDIYRSASATGTFSRLGSEPSVSSGSTTTYSDTGLSASTTYYYKISALNNNGESAASSAVAGTTSSVTTTSSSGTIAVSSAATTTDIKKEETKKEEAKKVSAGELVWAFKDGKFQQMSKTEAGALYGKAEAAEKAETKAAGKPDAKKEATSAKAEPAKPKAEIRALPHLSAQAAKVVTSVLKRSAIMILPQDQGKAFYIDPKTQEKASLGRPAEAFNVMRSFGIGITNKDIERIPESTEDRDTTFACKQAGKIFLQVQSKGEAWYVHPENCKRYFLNRPADAFDLMRKLALGVSNADAAAIPISDKSAPATQAKPAQPKEEPKKAAVPATPALQALDKLPSLARPLYNGMKGDDVKTLQTVLSNEGFYDDAITGVMNKETFAAVREMQLEEGLVKSKTTPGFGDVGPATRAFVNKLLKEAKAEETPAKKVEKPAVKKEEKKKEAAPTKEPVMCAQVITAATSPDGECREFPTPCDVPEKWKKAGGSKCPAPSKSEQVAPKSSDKGESALDKLKRLLKQ